MDKLFRRIVQFGGHSRQGGGALALKSPCGTWPASSRRPPYQLLGGKFRDRVRMYCDTDLRGQAHRHRHGPGPEKRMEQGFTFLKMDLGTELLDEPGALNAPLASGGDSEVLRPRPFSTRAAPLTGELMRHKNYEVFTIPHYATGIHITEAGAGLSGGLCPPNPGGDRLRGAAGHRPLRPCGVGGLYPLCTAD